MCCGGFPSLMMMGYKRKEITVIRFDRIHRFACDRWLNADSLGAAKFWKSLMDWCVTTKTEFVLESEDEDA